MKHKKITILPTEAPSVPEKKKISKLRELLKAFLIFIPTYGIFYIAVIFEFKYIYPIYLTVLVVFLVLYMLFNHGLSKELPTPDDLPSDWDESRKREYISMLAVGKERGRKLMLFIIPLIMTFFVDAVVLFVVDSINSFGV